MLALEAIEEQFSDNEIYILDIAEKNLIQVTNDEYFDALPMWVEL